MSQAWRGSPSQADLFLTRHCWRKGLLRLQGVSWHLILVYHTGLYAAPLAEWHICCYSIGDVTPQSIAALSCSRYVFLAGPLSGGLSCMSDGGSGERRFSLVRSYVWSSYCWLKHAKEVRTVDAGPSPSSHSKGSLRRFVARLAAGAAPLKLRFSADATSGPKSLCRLSLPVLSPPGI